MLTAAVAGNVFASPSPDRVLEGIKAAEATFTGCKPEWAFLEGVTAKVAVAHGLNNARNLIEKVRAGEASYHFIEIMTCPGGCLGGGGQPLPVTPEKRIARAEALYAEDAAHAHRKSHENPAVQALYRDFLGEPNSHLAHELLHTCYVARGRY